jgi:hypothetical protein
MGGMSLITQWYTQQTQISPSQFLSRARQSHIITPQQYQAIARSPAAQAEFTEGYKAQLESIVRYDASGNLSRDAVTQLANLRSSFQGRKLPGLGEAREGTSA